MKLTSLKSRHFKILSEHGFELNNTDEYDLEKMDEIVEALSIEEATENPDERIKIISEIITFITTHPNW